MQFPKPVQANDNKNIRNSRHGIQSPRPDPTDARFISDWDIAIIRRYYFCNLKKPAGSVLRKVVFPVRSFHQGVFG